MRSAGRLLALLAAALAARPAAALPPVPAGLPELRAERPVALRRLRLTVSPDRVRAELEVRNETGEPLVGEVAFPVPAHGPGPERAALGFRDYRAWVNELGIPLESEGRAFLGERDVTELLHSAGLDPAGFGGQERLVVSADGRTLERQPATNPPATFPADKLVELRRAGLLGPAGPAGAPPAPLWTVQAVHRWLQRFPPSQLVHLAAEYRPVAGAEVGIAAAVLEASCANPALRKRAGGRLQRSGETGSGVRWVKVLLGSARSWKTPIGEMELTAEGPDDEYLAFCWDGPIRKTGPNVYRAARSDLTPAQDLTVYWFRIGPDRPAR